MKKRVRLTESVQIEIQIKNRVAKKVVGTKENIGKFFSRAAVELLKKENQHDN